MSDDLVKRLRDPEFGTETTERNLMNSAADRIEALEARIAKADALADGRPCATDVWLQSAFEHIHDHYDFREAIKDWLHGDWSGAMEWVEEYREGSDT